MKKIVFLSLLLFFEVNCKNDLTITPSSNITLYDKPAEVIQGNIQGKWKLEFEQGGITGGTFYPENTFYTFDQNRVISTKNGNVVFDATISWKKEIYNQSTKATTYLMVFDTNSVNFFVEGIVNDTLVFHDYNISDGFTYHLSRK